MVHLACACKLLALLGVGLALVWVINYLKNRC